MKTSTRDRDRWTSHVEDRAAKARNPYSNQQRSSHLWVWRERRPNTKFELSDPWFPPEHCKQVESGVTLLSVGCSKYLDSFRKSLKRPFWLMSPEIALAPAWWCLEIGDSSVDPFPDNSWWSESCHTRPVSSSQESGRRRSLCRVFLQTTSPWRTISFQTTHLLPAASKKCRDWNLSSRNTNQSTNSRFLNEPTLLHFQRLSKTTIPILNRNSSIGSKKPHKRSSKHLPTGKPAKYPSAQVLWSTSGQDDTEPSSDRFQDTSAEQSTQLLTRSWSPGFSIHSISKPLSQEADISREPW